MYKQTGRIPKNWSVGLRGRPLICLEDQHGGQSVITMDDGCYVLYNGSDDREFRQSSYWYPEAAKALAEIVPLYPRIAYLIKT